MGFNTNRMELFKVDTSLAASDPVDVNQNLNSNYDILDDNAPIRTRANGIFPTPTETYPGGMVYHPNGKVFAAWDDGQYRPLKQVPSFVKKLGNVGASIVTGADVYLNWGHTEDRDGMEFEASGAIRFKKTGLYIFTCAFNLDGTAGNYERYLMVMLSDGGGGRKARYSQNRTVGNVARNHVAGFVGVDGSMVGWRIQAAIFQNSGGTVVYNDTQAYFGCTRVGGFLGD